MNTFRFNRFCVLLQHYNISICNQKSSKEYKLCTPIEKNIRFPNLKHIQKDTFVSCKYENVNYMYNPHDPCVQYY